MKTARYANAAIDVRKFIPIGISLGAPKFPLQYKLTAFYQTLAPTREILAISDSDSYRTLYRKRLDLLGFETIQNGLRAFQDNNKELLLLCFEDLRLPGQFCHRRFFAEWWKEQTGERVDELDEIERVRQYKRSPSPTLFDL